MRLVLYLAFRQLKDKKLLNAIAVAGVALGVCALIAMNAIMQGFQVRFKSEILKVSPHVVVNAKELHDDPPILARWAGARGVRGDVLASVAREQPSERQTAIKRPYEIVRMLESLPDVEAACLGLAGQAIVGFGAQTLGVDLRGVDPEEQNRCTPLAGYVRDGSWRTFTSDRDGIAMGSGVAEQLGATLGDRVTVVSQVGGRVQLTVTAILDAQIPSVDKTRAYVHLAKAQALLRRGNDVGRMELRLHDPWRSELVAARVEQLTGYDAEGWQESNANFLSLFTMQNMIVDMQIGLLLIVGGFGILSIQIMLVLQKMRDIAILRSVGLRRADILGIVLVQGLVVAALGGLFGNLLGWRLVHFLGTLPVKSEGLVKSTTFQVYEDPAFYVYGVAFAVVVGLAASVLPALRASRIEPVEVLRGRLG